MKKKKIQPKIRYTTRVQAFVTAVVPIEGGAVEVKNDSPTAVNIKIDQARSC